MGGILEVRRRGRSGLQRNVSHGDGSDSFITSPVRMVSYDHICMVLVLCHAEEAEVGRWSINSSTDFWKVE